MTGDLSLRVASGAPFWLLRHGLLPAAEPAAVPASADVVIVGAGITGALLADAFVRAGQEVLLLERHGPTEGSTGVSTALLQYELDVELVDLTAMMGEEKAVRAYRRCARAIDELELLVASLGEDCHFSRGTSIYLASRRRDVGRLRTEAEARGRAGLAVRYLSRNELLSRYGVAGHAALETDHAATVDPVGLARALLRRAIDGGAMLCPRTAQLGWTAAGSRIRVTTNRGDCIAGAIIFATGYEVPPILPRDIVSLHSTYAMVTQPAADLGALRNGTMFWETARPYAYLRSTPDSRILIGGMDAPFRNADIRDALLPLRTRALEKGLARFLGAEPPETAFAWAGTFGETRDGLPYIGPVPGHPGAYAALGYGGNGIVFSTVAADLLTALVLEGGHPDAGLFGLERISAAG